MQIIEIAPAVHRTQGAQAGMTTGAVGPLLARLTLPMVFGVWATIGTSVAEAWFIGRLGPQPLAAVSFTLPVAMVVINLAIGRGAGTSAVVARALGAGQDVGGLVSDALLLAAFLGAPAIGAGLVLLDPLFRLMGAPGSLVPQIEAYLDIWFPAALLFMLSMVGLSAARAAGDALFQGLATAASALVNLALAPVFILSLGFGLPDRGRWGGSLDKARYFTVV